MKSILFVSGFDSRTRARELGYEFERYGRLVRCDIPAPRPNNPNPRPIAFVEFENLRDAEDAMAELNGRGVNGYTLQVQWARPNNRYYSMHNRRSSSPRGRSPPPHPPSRRYSRSPIRQEHRRSLSPISDGA